jgi:hypothetical protein
MADQERRRRRLRQRPRPAAPAPDEPERSAVTAAVEDSQPAADAQSRTAADGRAGLGADAGSGTGGVPRQSGLAQDDRESERGLRGLVGSGASQVGTGAALRARDAARPTAADLAEAEERLVVVRRNWSPRDDAGRGR